MQKQKIEWIPGIEGYQIKLNEDETMKIFWEALNPETAPIIAFGGKNDKIIVVYSEEGGKGRIAHITLNDVMLFQVNFKVNYNKEEE